MEPGRKHNISRSFLKKLTLLSLSLDTIFYVVAFGVSALSLSLITINETAISSVCFYAGIATVMVWFVIKTIQIITSAIQTKNYWTISILGATIALVTGILMALEILITSNGQLAFDYLKPAVLNFLPIAMMILAVFGTYNQNFLNAFTKFFLTVFILATIVSLGSGIGRKYIAGGLTVNFANPNLTSLVYTVVFILFACWFFPEQNIFKKIAYGLFAAGSLTIVLMTRCRTALIAIFGSILIVFLHSKIKNSGKIDTIIVAGTILFPLVLICGYVILGKGTNFLTILQDLTPGEKSFYTRMRPWVDGLKYFSEHPIFGGYSEAYAVYLVDGMMPGFESGQLTFLSLFGLINYSFYVIVAFICGMHIFKSIDKYSSLSKCLFAFFFISTLSLSGPFMGGNGYNIVSMLPMAVSRPAKKYNFVRKDIPVFNIKI